MWWPDHIGIVVSNLDVSVKFYCTLLGTQPAEKVVYEGQEAEFVRHMLATPDLDLHVAFIDVPYSHTLLELLEYRGLQNKGQKPPPATALGAVHLAFYVDDIEAAHQRVKAAGSDFLAEPVVMPAPSPYRGGRTAYFRDPDGVNLQLMEVTRRPGQRPLLRASAPVD